MIITRQDEIVFENCCGAIVNSLSLEHAVLSKAKKPVARLKKIFMHGKYPAVAIHKQKYHIHRLLMEYWETRKLKSSEYVHHKNGNKLDATRSNLEIVKASVHQSEHNRGRKQTKEHVAKRTASMKRTRYENSDLLTKS